MDEVIQNNQSNNQSNFFSKYRWLILLIIVIVSVLVFRQFYSIQVIKKHSNIPASVGLGTVACQEDLGFNDLNIGDVGTTVVANLGGANIDTDKANLSNDDLDSVQAFLKFKQIKADIIPSGVPKIYGQELGISFDAVQDAIDKVVVFGPTYGQEDKKIVLTDQSLERYIDIGLQTSCQYCCTAKALVREDGEAACGCAHSIMMRGLAAYLIQNHPEMSNEQILRELNIWKSAYFPKQTLTETLQELKQSGEKGIEQLLQEFPDFLPQMVGGC